MTGTSSKLRTSEKAVSTFALSFLNQISHFFNFRCDSMLASPSTYPCQWVSGSVSDSKFQIWR